MKILFVTPAPRAGSQQYTHQLANALVEKGHEVQVATAIDFEMKPYPQQYRAWEIFDGFKPHPILMQKFLRGVKRFSPDVVHFVGAQQPMAYLVFGKLIRIVTNAHFVFTPQDVLPNHSRRLDRWALPHLYKKMKHVFINAEQNRQQMIEAFGVDPTITTVVPIPDHLAFLRTSVKAEAPDLDPALRVILCFGLIEPRKGIPTLLDAMPKITKGDPNIYAIIAGKPLMDIEPLREKIETQGLSDNVLFIPRYLSFNEMAGYFSRSECLVLPYHSGWNSGVVASAFGHGKPVIATDVGGFREVIEDGETGLIVPPADPDALADAVLKLLGDPELQRRISEKGLEIDAAQSWEQLAGTCQSVYDQVISAG